MLKELKIFIYLFTIFLSFTFLFKYYFSDNYKKHSYRILNNLDSKILNQSTSLNTLSNDTKNIIIYPENNSNKKKKYFFFELLNLNDK
tara:strand:- start:519 stop:782 length:264 start_codon:yes stop_codon:yes gene_type:complete